MERRPVYIGFNPPLFLQRQGFILESLREIKPSSVIDVGCGNGRILECLVRCDDDLPVENLVGLDIDRASLQSAAASIQSTGNNQQAEGRWRPVQVTLLEGKFTQINLVAGDAFDAVVSSEVIEHLDPEDLEKYFDIHLGILRPARLIVTTPNRDFNIIFDEEEKTSRVPIKSYAREGLDYRVRHDDHRFEYSQSEFETVSKEAATRFGYEVTFTGVGSVQNALSEFPEIVEKYKPANLGYCTQIAVFTRSSLATTSTSPTSTWENFETVAHLSYPRNINTEYPPLPLVIARAAGGMWRHFRPEYTALNAQPSFIGSLVASAFGAEYIESEDVVTCKVSLETLWDLNFELGKSFRFHKDVFSHVAEKLDGQSFDREFVGFEAGGGSLRSFRFTTVDNQTFAFYEYSKDTPNVVSLVE